MSSNGQSTSFTYNIDFFTDALAEYARITGKDLSKDPLAATLERSNSLETILNLLREREKAFKKFRNKNQKLLNYVTPCVKVLHAVSGTLGEALSLPAAHFPPAKAVLVGIDVLLVTASKVSSSYNALLKLFGSLENFLKRLEVYSTIPPTAMASMTDIINKIMIELLSVLALATKQINEGRIKKFVKLLWGEDEIQATLQRLDILTNFELLAVVTRILAAVHNLADNEEKKMKHDVQHWLSPPDSTNHEFFSKLRHRGTAEWFFESNVLTEWKRSGSLLWIHGKPGAGKSTLLSAIIQDFERIHAPKSTIMAYYYFDFRDDKQDRYGLLSSLISQLSAGSDSFFQVLFQLYSNDAGRMPKPITSKLTKCLKDMLSLPGQNPIYIIIDGVDECPTSPGTPSAREEVLGLIKELVDLTRKLPEVHLCVASRPEIDIRMVLEPLTSLRISLHDERGQKEDIISYIKSFFHSEKNMQTWREEDKQLVVDTLSDKADGMFQYVVCQVDTLRRIPLGNSSIRSVLKDLPKTLDETYSRTLLGIDEEKRRYARQLFRCLTVSIRPLRVEELAEFLTVQFNEAAPSTSQVNTSWHQKNAETVVMSVCSSLIDVVDRGNHRVVQFSHFSIKEFLTSKRLATAEEHLSYFHVSPEPAHTILVRTCLSVLLQLDDKIDKNTISHFPLAPYAALYWVHHARLGQLSHIQEAIERLFNPKKPHFAAWVWLHDIDRHWLKPMSKNNPTDPEAVPLYYASLCGFRDLVEHLITTHSSDVNTNGGFHATPLHAASVKGHLDVVSLLLKSGADPNSRDDAGRVPLHRVSQGGHRVTAKSALEIAQLLVDFRAKANIADHDGWTPLHAAAHSGYRDIAELLLESGASLDVQNKNQETPLHLACFNGNLDVSRFLIGRGSDVNSQDKNGFTPLNSASRYGHVVIARLLLDGGSEVNVCETQQWSPLHQASRYGHLDVAQLLIDRGADLNAHKANRWTSLHLASNNGHLDIAKLLIDRGANINSRNDKEETPLDRALEKGYLDVTRLLINSGAAVSDASDKGWTPLHKAAYHGHTRITKFLLENIDIDIRNANGQTSLYLASSSGKFDVVSFLIKKGANIHISDNNGSNPLHIASHNGHLDVVQLLIDSGTPINIRNGSQKTPLALASIKGKVGVGRYLIERGADINARDNQSQAPLHFASRHGHHDMARLLLGHRVDVNIQRDDLWSPLHLASANGHVNVTKLLVQCGASIDMFNGKRETPLYQAVWNGEVAVADLLIDHGANLHVTDSHGGTLLHAASKRGHLGVVKLLFHRGANVNMLNKANQTAAELALENDQAEVAKFIAEYKVDANIQDKICPTALFDTAQYGADDEEKDEEMPSLHVAAKEGNVDVLKLLLEQGTDANVRNEGHRTPLNLAAANGNVHAVRLLIERGAEVDSCDMWGWTPLHAASRFGHLEVSRVLIERGANVNARQKSSSTPLYLSARHGHLGIVKLLLEHGADKHALNDKGETPYQAAMRIRRREIVDLLHEPSAN